MPAERHAPIIFFRAGILITAHPDRLVATMPDSDFLGLSTEHLKRFPHVDNLYDLPLRGLLRLAEEFYSELSKQLTSGETNGHKRN